MTDEHPIDERELGEITRCYNILYERRSKHSVARVWRAITDPGELSRWMRYPVRVDLRVGGDYFVDFQDDSPEGLDGIITAIEPERRLTYAWGLSVLEWKLEPDEATGGCTYTFLHHGMPVRGIPDEEGVAAGWHVWLDELEDHLDGRSISRESSSARYAALCPCYRARIEAAIGPL